jgi:hypothetical protein
VTAGTCLVATTRVIGACLVATTNICSPYLYTGDGANGWCSDSSFMCKTGSKAFYITSGTPTTYIYSATIYLGYTTGTTVSLRGNAISADCWSVSTAGTITGKIVASTTCVTAATTVTGACIYGSTWICGGQAWSHTSFITMTAGYGYCNWGTKSQILNTAAADWKFATGGINTSTAVRICFFPYVTSADTHVGSVYGSASGIGFLGCHGGWQLLITPGTSCGVTLTCLVGCVCVGSCLKVATDMCAGTCVVGAKLCGSTCVSTGYLVSTGGICGYSYVNSGAYMCATTYLQAATCVVSGTYVYANAGLYVNCSNYPAILFNCAGTTCTRIVQSGAVMGFQNGEGTAWHWYSYVGCMCICGAIGYMSSRSIKCDYRDIDVLAGIRRLCVQAWKYRSGGGWHAGPYAEDFQREFPWLGDGTGVQSLDALALRGVQEVDARVTALEARIANLEAQLAAAAA